jgi:hypothetical protein
MAEGLLTTVEKWVTHQIGRVIAHEAMLPALVMVAGMSQLLSPSGGWLHRWAGFRDPLPHDGLPSCAWHLKSTTASCGRRRTVIRRLWSDKTLVQFDCQPVDFPSELGVGLEFQFLLLEVMIGLSLLERRLSILADHDEG